MAVEEMRLVVQSMRIEARFICFYMARQDQGMFLTLAYDEGLMNSEYLFYGEARSTASILSDNFIHGQREDIDLKELLIGTLLVSIPVMTGPDWIHLRQDIVTASQEDGHFVQGPTIPRPGYVIPMAGKYQVQKRNYISNMEKVIQPVVDVLLNANGIVCQMLSWRTKNRPYFIHI